MKIVHIALCGPVTDGWNYQDNMIPMYNAQDGHEVTMITSQSVFTKDGTIGTYNKSDYYYDGVKIIRLKMVVGKNAFSQIKKYSGLKEVLENEQPNLIFIHNISFLDIYQISDYAKKHKVTIYADNHNDCSNSGRNFISKNILHKGLWRHMAQVINPYVTTFYGVLPARVDFLKDVYGLPKNKVEILVMGADDKQVERVEKERIREKIRGQYKVEENDFLVMTGGKIDSFKWQTLLLMEAVANCKIANIKLIVFGSVSQDLKPKFERLVDDNRIKYIGWINTEQSYDCFSAADLVVFPGRHSVFWEEVAGLGIPMLCKYWDGTTHIECGGNVHFLHEDSAAEIESELEKLVGTAEYDKMKHAAIRNKDRFSYREIARRAIGDKRQS